MPHATARAPGQGRRGQPGDEGAAGDVCVARAQRQGGNLERRDAARDPRGEPSPPQPPPLPATARDPSPVRKPSPSAHASRVGRSAGLLFSSRPSARVCASSPPPAGARVCYAGSAPLSRHRAQLPNERALGQDRADPIARPTLRAAPSRADRSTDRERRRAPRPPLAPHPSTHHHLEPPPRTLEHPFRPHPRSLPPPLTRHAVHTA